VQFRYKHKPNKNKTSLFYLSNDITIKIYCVYPCTYTIHVIRAAHLPIQPIKKDHLPSVGKKIIVKIIILFQSNIIFEGTHGHIDIYAKLTQNFVIRGVYKPFKSIRHFRIIDSLLTRVIK